MKITDVEILQYNYSVDEAMKKNLKKVPDWYRVWHYAATGWEGGAEDRQEVIVRLHTDEGITGIGSADKGHKHPAIVISVIEKLLKKAVIGENPLNVERLWQKMYDRCGNMVGGVRGIGYGAIGGINTACWDILGKKVGAPIYELLGGDANIPIRPYIGTWTMGWREMDDLDSIVEEARFYVNQGYEAIKFRAGRGLPDPGDIETIKALRKAFPPDKLTLMCDVNGGYTVEQAAVMAKEFEQYDLFWMEDPFKTRDLTRWAELQKLTRTNIMAGGGPTTIELKQMLDRGIMPNIISLCAEHAGGISEALKVATICHVWERKVAGISHEPLGSLAMFHAWISGLTEGTFVEYDPVNSLWSELMTDPPVFKDHRLVLSDKPGLGTDINDDFIKAHPVPDELMSEL
jgi:L-alanine-DL-glutamate epimerase-like enolase superfamily enzyme